jgi:hypothetical protein
MKQYPYLIYYKIFQCPNHTYLRQHTTHYAFFSGGIL